MSKRSFETAAVRSFTIVGHRSSGKTTVGDAILSVAGVTRSPGRVDDGTSLLDHEPEERKNRLSLGPSLAWMNWNEHLLYMMDSPGSELVAHERVLPIAGTDGVVIVVSAPDNIEVGTERALEQASEQVSPRLVLVNKMDREHDLEAIHRRLRGLMGNTIVPVQVPWYDEKQRFVGCICLIRNRLFCQADGSEVSLDVPEVARVPVEAAREVLVEAVALANDELLEEYLEFFSLRDEQLQRGLAAAVRKGLLVPVMYASGRQVIGLERVLFGVCEFLPSPEQAALPEAFEQGGAPVDLRDQDRFVAQVLFSRLDEDNERYHVIRVWSGTPGRHGKWHNGTNGEPVRVRRLYQIRGPRRCGAFHVGAGALFATWDDLKIRPGDCITEGAAIDLVRPAFPPPMMALSLRPVSPGYGRRLDEAVKQILSMDASLKSTSDETTGAIVLSGIGEGHLRRAIRQMENLSGIKLEVRLPEVGYREVPLQAVKGVEGVHERIADGAVAEFGACRLDVFPDANLANSFVDHTDDDEVPGYLRGSIDEGVRKGMRHGPTAGYPVIGAQVSLEGGDYNILSSTDEHLQHASTKAVQNALTLSGTYLLEPWCRVDIWSPCELGAVLSDVSSNRGRVLGLEVEGKDTHIQASYPYRELRTFANRLNSLTGGRGRFSYSVSHYDRLPADQVQEVINRSPFRMQGAEGSSNARGAK
jgi:elongation factor G